MFTCEAPIRGSPMVSKVIELETDSSALLVGDGMAIGDMERRARIKPEEVEEEISDLAAGPTCGKVIAIPTGADGAFRVSVGIADEKTPHEPMPSGNALHLEVDSGQVVVCSPEDVTEGLLSKVTPIPCPRGGYELTYAVHSASVTISLRPKRCEGRSFGEGSPIVSDGTELTISGTGARNMMVGFTIAGAVLSGVGYFVVLAIVRLFGSNASLGFWHFWPLSGGLIFLLASYLLARSQRDR